MYIGSLNGWYCRVKARAEVKYGPREYMADVGWLHRGIPASFNTRAGAELSYLSKTYGPSAEVSRRNQDFSTTVEVKGGDNGKVGGSC